MGHRRKFDLSKITIIDLDSIDDGWKSKSAIGHIKRLKRGTTDINFRCDESRCKDKWVDPDQSKQMCCCYGCSYSCGYLTGEVIELKNIQTYLDNWNKLSGFWRPDIGCILPRELRSITCVTYSCNAVVNRILSVIAKEMRATNRKLSEKYESYGGEYVTYL